MVGSRTPAGTFSLLGFARARKPELRPGMLVFVRGPDGKRSEGQCRRVRTGSVYVAFGDGRQAWVLDSLVTRQD
jgi:hypothetical protein